MRAFHACIEDRDCYAAAARRNVPRLWRLDFWQMPGKGVVRVVWNQARLVDAIQLGELDARMALQCLENSVPCGLRALLPLTSTPLGMYVTGWDLQNPRADALNREADVRRSQNCTKQRSDSRRYHRANQPHFRRR